MLARPLVIRTRPVPERACCDDAGVYSDDTTPATRVDVTHTCTGTAHDQDSRRPRRRGQRRIGYARTMQAQTDLQTAVKELRALNVDSEHIYIDRGNDALASNRPQLAAALHTARAGDSFVIADLARLARTLAELHTLTQDLADRHLHLEVNGTDFHHLAPSRLLALTVDMNTRLTMEALEEQRSYDHSRIDVRGGHRKLSPLNRLRMRELFDAGLPRNEIATLLQVGRATIYRDLSNPADKA